MSFLRIPVPLSARSYDVWVGENLIRPDSAWLDELPPGRSCAMVSDETVDGLFGVAVEEILRARGRRVERVVVAPGETSKSFRELERVCDRLIAAGLDRTSFLVALGGGVVGDLAGFAAAVFYRGIPFVQIPTTVVAQVDSSVGGKTGINAAGGKNLIGAFHQPRLVVADVGLLATLPPRERDEGFAEIIKHAAIRKPEMLDALEPGTGAEWAALIAENVRIKARVVADDEQETRGVRALLNFGHTVGHAVENAAGYGEFLHGEAISIGLAVALRLSVEQAGLESDAAERVLAALARRGLPTKVPSGLSTDRLMAALARDKKFEAGDIRFVLVPRLGEAIVSRDVTGSAIAAAIDACR